MLTNIADDKLFKSYEDNIKAAIYRRGGKVPGYKPSAADDLVDKGVGGGKTGTKTGWYKDADGVMRNHK